MNGQSGSLIKRQHSHLSAFTMVEMLIVIVIIAILAGLSGVAALRSREKAKVTFTESTIRGLAIGLDQYNAQFQYYPRRGGIARPNELDDPIENNHVWARQGKKNNAHFEYLLTALDRSGFAPEAGALVERENLAGEFRNEFDADGDSPQKVLVDAWMRPICVVYRYPEDPANRSFDNQFFRGAPWYGADDNNPDDADNNNDTAMWEKWIGDKTDYLVFSFGPKPPLLDNGNIDVDSDDFLKQAIFNVGQAKIADARTVWSR